MAGRRRPCGVHEAGTDTGVGKDVGPGQKIQLRGVPPLACSAEAVFLRLWASLRLCLLPMAVFFLALASRLASRLALSFSNASHGWLSVLFSNGVGLCESDPLLDGEVLESSSSAELGPANGGAVTTPVRNAISLKPRCVASADSLDLRRIARAAAGTGD